MCTNLCCATETTSQTESQSYASWSCATWSRWHWGHGLLHLTLWSDAPTSPVHAPDRLTIGSPKRRTHSHDIDLWRINACAVPCITVLPGLFGVTPVIRVWMDGCRITVSCCDWEEFNGDASMVLLGSTDDWTKYEMRWATKMKTPTLRFTVRAGMRDT